MDKVELIEYLKAQAEVYGSQKGLAHHCGVGTAYISEIMRGTREPGPKVLRALGLKKVVRYEPIEAEDEL